MQICSWTIYKNFKYTIDIQLIQINFSWHILFMLKICFNYKSVFFLYFNQLSVRTKRFFRIEIYVIAR